MDKQKEILDLLAKKFKIYKKDVYHARINLDVANYLMTKGTEAKRHSVNVNRYLPVVYSIDDTLGQ